MQKNNAETIKKADKEANASLSAFFSGRKRLSPQQKCFTIYGLQCFIQHLPTPQLKGYQEPQSTFMPRQGLLRRERKQLFNPT